MQTKQNSQCGEACHIRVVPDGLPHVAGERLRCLTKADFTQRLYFREFIMILHVYTCALDKESQNSQTCSRNLSTVNLG